MRYAGMPAGMWTLFRNSFRKNLGDVLGYDREKAGEVTEKAKSACICIQSRPWNR